jgi:hypothetical protein
LADFDRRLGDFERRGAVVAGASSDGYDDARQTWSASGS